MTADALKASSGFCRRARLGASCRKDAALKRRCIVACASWLSRELFFDLSRAFLDQLNARGKIRWNECFVPIYPWWTFITSLKDLLLPLLS
jgi:hypothetical protein